MTGGKQCIDKLSLAVGVKFMLSMTQILSL